MARCVKYIEKETKPYLFLKIGEEVRENMEIVCEHGDFERGKEE